MTVTRLVIQLRPVREEDWDEAQVDVAVCSKFRVRAQVSVRNLNINIVCIIRELPFVPFVVVVW